MIPRTETWFFLRGLVRESGHWAGFLEKFESAFPHRRAVALDLPGNGTKFLAPSPLSIQVTAESLRADFLKFRGEKNFLFAISLGAMVGIEWMHKHPQDFQGAVLGNTSLRGLSPLHHRLKPKNWAKILKLMLVNDPPFRERTILEITSERKDLFGKLEKDWVEIQRQRPVTVKNALRQLLAAARFHPPKEKPALPLLILNGAKDGLVNPLCSAALARHWDAPLRVNSESGHDITLDQPEWVIEQLRSPWGQEN